MEPGGGVVGVAGWLGLLVLPESLTLFEGTSHPRTSQLRLSCALFGKDNKAGHVCH